MLSKRYPKEQLNYIINNILFLVWPELKKHDNIHIIYAGLHVDYNFEFRDFTDLLDEIKNALDCGKNKFFFICEAEDIQLQHVDVVHKLIDKSKEFTNNLKHTDCVFLFGAENLEQVYVSHCEKNGYSNKIHLLSVRHFERTMQAWTKKQKNFEDFNSYKISLKKDKKFLCFNKVPREHRIMLLDKIFEHDLLDQAYYSFQGEILFWETDKTWLDTVDQKYIHFLQHKDKFPLVLNITPERNNPVDIIPDDYKYFDNSYFSVVTETVYEENNDTESSIFFSEKVWKPIIMQHPFILVGRYKMLAKLKEYGYKSFDPWIDESYDNIRNPEKRMDAIVEEIKRLCSLTDDQYVQWQQAIAPVVDYNRLHFFKNKSFGIPKNISHLFGT